MNIVTKTKDTAEIENTIVNLLKNILTNIALENSPENKYPLNNCADNLLLQVMSFSSTLFTSYEWFRDERSLKFSCDNYLNECLALIGELPLPKEAKYISLTEPNNIGEIIIKISFKNKVPIYIENRVLLSSGINIHSLIQKLEKIKNKMCVEECFM